MNLFNACIEVLLKLRTFDKNVAGIRIIWSDGKSSPWVKWYIAIFPPKIE